MLNSLFEVTLSDEPVEDHVVHFEVGDKRLASEVRVVSDARELHHGRFLLEQRF